MGNPLRVRRTPSEWAENGQIIEFSEKVSEFERLSEIVKDDLAGLQPAKLRPSWRNSVVAGRLSFGFSATQGGLPALRGSVTATIDAVCQRCLEAFQWPLAVDIRLLFAVGELATTDDGFEVWELEEDELRPLDLVEEVLIMALPLAATHIDSETCKAIEATQVSEERTRPFATLRSQMENTD